MAALAGSRGALAHVVRLVTARAHGMRRHFRLREHDHALHGTNEHEDSLFGSMELVRPMAASRTRYGHRQIAPWPVADGLRSCYVALGARGERVSRWSVLMRVDRSYTSRSVSCLAPRGVVTMPLWQPAQSRPETGLAS